GEGDAVEQAEIAVEFFVCHPERERGTWAGGAARHVHRAPPARVPRYARDDIRDQFTENRDRVRRCAAASSAVQRKLERADFDVDDAEGAQTRRECGGAGGGVRRG